MDQKTTRILVCEDEKTIRDFIIINLQRSGYETIDVSSGEAALETFKNHNNDFDIAILDIMLPGIDGFEVCKQLRKLNETIGIIMLTAKTQEMDKVRGLMLGADDYVSKPFSPSELIARVDAIQRRINRIGKGYKKNETIIQGPFNFNTKNHTLIKSNVAIELTHVEYQLIGMFLKNPEIALQKMQILHEVWGKDYFGDLKIVDVNIRRLRMKIEDDPSKPNYIQTVWGYGYKWTIK